MIKNLDEYNPEKEKIKVQKESTLFSAKEFYKGRRMILIAFEIGAFPLPKQYPSGMHDWKEDELDPLYVLPDESGLSLVSVEKDRQ